MLYEVLKKKAKVILHKQSFNSKWYLKQYVSTYVGHHQVFP